MSWYYCPGCGPSQRCDVCGATECGQSLRPEHCPGCKKAEEAAAGPIPWNMRITPHGVRPWKHLRKRHTRCLQRMKFNTVKLDRWIRVRGRWVRNDFELTF